MHDADQEIEQRSVGNGKFHCAHTNISRIDIVWTDIDKIKKYCIQTKLLNDMCDHAQTEHAHDSTASIAGATTIAAAALSLSFARANDDDADDDDDDEDDDEDEDDADDDAVAGDSFLTSRKTSSAITDCNCAGVADADKIEKAITNKYW